MFLLFYPILRSEDDEKFNGISHFLEHIICNLSKKTDDRVGGDTFLYNTVYSFGRFSDSVNFWQYLSSTSNLMFSSEPIADYKSEKMKSVIDYERLRVNGECYEKLKEHSSNNRLEQIFRMYGIKMPKFGYGNIDSLPNSIADVRHELEERRKLYRGRPVFVCICSKQPLDDIQVVT